MKKILIFSIITAIIIFSVTIFTFAYEQSEIFDGYRDELDKNIPDEVKKYLDDQLIDELESESAAYALDISFWQRVVLEIFNDVIGAALGDFALTFSIVILTSLMSALKNTISSISVARSLDYISSLCLAGVVYKIILKQWDKVDKLLDTLGVFMNSILPAVGAMYVAGGNTTSATVNSGVFLIVINIMENICNYLLYPILSICFSLTFIASVTAEEGIRLSAISELVRKTFSGLIGFVMAFMTFVLSYQTVLAVGADNMAAKTIKFAAGNMIPVVGGAVSEAVRVIIGSLSFIKSSFGTIAVTAIVILLLPTFISLYLTRLCLGISGAGAEMIGCERDGRFLADIKNLCNLAVAICASSSLFFIFGLTVFIKTACTIST